MASSPGPLLYVKGVGLGTRLIVEQNEVLVGGGTSVYFLPLPLPIPLHYHYYPCACCKVEFRGTFFFSCILNVTRHIIWLLCGHVLCSVCCHVLCWWPRITRSLQPMTSPFSATAVTGTVKHDNFGRVELANWMVLKVETNQRLVCGWRLP